MTALPALADDFADGDKDWSSAINAISGTAQVPDSDVNTANNHRLRTDLWGHIDWSTGYHVELGYNTFRPSIFWTARDFYFGYSLPGASQTTRLSWVGIGNPGTTHHFQTYFDRSVNKWVFLFDGGNVQYSTQTDRRNIVTSWAGIYATPDSSAVKTNGQWWWNSFGWASFSEWYWHGGWPSPTYPYDVPDSVHMSGLPQDGTVWTWADGY